MSTTQERIHRMTVWKTEGTETRLTDEARDFLPAMATVVHSVMLRGSDGSEFEATKIGRGLAMHVFIPPDAPAYAEEVARQMLEESDGAINRAVREFEAKREAKAERFQELADKARDESNRRYQASSYHYWHIEKPSVGADVRPA